jgi:hypothetical protein
MGSGQRRHRRVFRVLCSIVAMTAPLSPLPGCAVRVRGVVESPDGAARLRMVDGRSLRLVALGPAAGLGDLDGAWVEVAGERTLGTLRVSWWTVTEGPHGFPAFVGILQPLGAQLAIADRGSGATLVLDPAITKSLWPDRGRLAVLEGYIDGPHQLHVTWSHVVAAEVPEAR